MKLKCIPEDFEVEEITSVAPTGRGRFALYRLTKQGLGTPEAVDVVGRAWHLPRRAVSYGGLKDRHALTRQFLTIEGGPRRDLEERNLALDYLGQVERPFTPADIEGNRFQIVLRAMSAEEERAAVDALKAMAEDGIPNYFDDQRFGSLGYEGVHVAVPWIRGDYEGTLKLGLAGATPMDRPRDRDEKQVLRDRWGDWPGLARDLQGSPRREVAGFLAARPGDFKGALALVRQDLRSLWLAAYQSDLWNRILSAWLQENVPAADLVDLAMKAATLPFPRALPEDVRERFHVLELPLPSSRVVVEEGPVKALVDRTLAAEGVTLKDLNVKAPRGSFFSKGWRAAALRPENVTAALADDDLYPGKRRLTLAFNLPRGAYATILVKRLTSAAT